MFGKKQVMQSILRVMLRGKKVMLVIVQAMLHEKRAMFTYIRVEGAV
ncbi:hypothetical protein GCM10027286_31580 [Virgibacillus ainsalahensis]